MTNVFSGYILNRKTPQLRQCSLCGKMRHDLWEVPIEGTTYLFCSRQEAEIGIKNYEENKKRGWTNIVATTVGEKPIIGDE